MAAPFTFTTDDILRELTAVTSTWHARAMMGRASKVAQVRPGALETTEMVLLLEALAAEGGAIQQIAEAMARRALSD